MTLNCWLTRSQSEWLIPPLIAPRGAAPPNCSGAAPAASAPAEEAGACGRSIVTRKNRCLPTFHSTSTMSKPSDRATRSAASRIRSKSISGRSVAPGRPGCDAFLFLGQQKSGLAPTEFSDRLQSENSIVLGKFKSKEHSAEVAQGGIYPALEEGTFTR